MRWGDGQTRSALSSGTSPQTTVSCGQALGWRGPSSMLKLALRDNQPLILTAKADSAGRTLFSSTLTSPA